MMSRRKNPDTDSSTAYTPMSDNRRQRRSDDADDAELRHWWRRVVKPTELAALTALLIALATALGLTPRMPGGRLNAVEVRVTEVEKRVDSLGDRLLFTNYMLCQQTKFGAAPAIPSWATARCDSIIQRRLAP